METVNVQVQRREALTGNLQTDLAHLRKMARLLDAQFSIVGVRFGLDSIIGLIPVAGDTVMAAIGIYPIYVAHKHNLGNGLKLRMAANLLIDWIGGSVPVAGDVFDVFFKSFMKNVTLLEKAVEKRAARP